MVLQLSESLDVPRASRNVLLTADGFARDLEQDEMAFVREAMNWTLNRHNQYPAIAVDRRWRLIQMNTCALARQFRGSARLKTSPLPTQRLKSCFRRGSSRVMRWSAVSLQRLLEQDN
jgi:hypothetical protein